MCLPQNAKRARSPDVEDTLPPPPDIKAIVKPLISKLIAMKWPGWSNPFSIVLKRSNAPPRYFEVVKRHMNLIYIRDNINKNRYSTVSRHWVTGLAGGDGLCKVGTFSVCTIDTSCTVYR